MPKEKLVRLKVKDIKVGKRHRPIDARDDEAMLSLAESVKTDGLIQPITVYKDNQLVTGARRLFAHVINEEDMITAIWKPYNDIQAERAEILENMDRKQLTALQNAQQTLRLKELYILEHPETEMGGDRKSEDFKTAERRFDSFAADTARKVGKSKTTIERDIKLATDLDPEVMEDLRGTPIEDKKTELTRLAKLPTGEQKKIAKKLKAGQITRVPSTKAVVPKPPRPRLPKPNDAEVDRDEAIDISCRRIKRFVASEMTYISKLKGGCLQPAIESTVRAKIDSALVVLSKSKSEQN